MSTHRWQRTQRSGRHVPLASIALALSAVPATTSCTGCTLQGWSEGFTLSLRSASGSFEGAYTVAITADGTSVEIPISVAEADHGMTCQTSDGRCGVQVDLGSKRALWISIDRFAIDNLTINMHHGDADGVDGGPRVATVSLSREGVVLGALTIEPRYTQTAPNGDGCPLATTASAELVLAAQ